MNPLQFLVNAFVNTFGITRPTPRHEQRAGWFIAGMLLLILIVLAGVGWLLRNALLR